MNALTLRLSRALAVALALAGLSACGDNNTPAPDGGVEVDGGGGDTDGGGGDTDGGALLSIAATASGNPDFSMLVAAATRAGLVETLDGGGPFTVFAPTNAAFAASGITMEMIDTMPADALGAILRYHALLGAVRAADVTAGAVGSVGGPSLILGTTGGVTLNGGNAVTGGANVVTADIEASNGVIHVIDRVLLPPTVADLTRYAGLTSLAGAVTSAGLAETLGGAGPFTVFAPTNDAFGMLSAVPTGDALRTVLLYHVVGANVPSSSVPAMASSAAQNAYMQNLTLLFDTSSGVQINGGSDAAGATVVLADVVATNGVVHVIDRVLLPMNVPAAATAAGLTGLLGAVTAAAALPDGTSVAAALSAEAPYTVLAPTNDAFTAIASTVATLTTAQVRDVLLYHVLSTTAFPMPVLSTALPSVSSELATLNAANTITFEPGPPPTFEGHGVVTADIVVTNGVIHVVDGVLVPATL